MLRKTQLLTILLASLLVLSACSRGNKTEEEPAVAPPAEAPATEAPAVETPTVEAQPPAPETPPTATPAPEEPAKPAVILPTPTPDSDAAAPPAQEEAAAPAAPPAGGPVQAVETLESVNAYRTRMSMTFESPADSGTVAIEGEYVKAPPAQRIRLDAQTGGESQQMEMVFVDGAYYFNVDGVWMQLPSPMFDIEGMVPVESQDAAEMLSYMKEVGVETVNGRETIHYQGDQNSFPEEAMTDVGVEILQWDLWIDRQEDVLIKFTMEAIDSSADGGPTQFMLTTEYYDLNADIVIQAPEVTTP